MDTNDKSELNETSVSNTTVPEAAPVTPATAPEVPEPEVTASSDVPADVPAAPQATTPVSTVSEAPSDPTLASTPLFSSDVPAAGTPVSSGGGGSALKRRWLLPAAGAAVLVALLVGGYVFGFYLPNTPSAVYSASLKNSGDAVDKLLQYGTVESAAKSTSATFDGTLKFKSSGVSGDATLSGAFDKDQNGNLKVDANIAGEKIAAEVRSVHAKGNDTPDVYVQLTGVKSALDSYGLSSLSGSVEGKWIAVDHTLLDTYVSSLKTTADSQTGSSVAAASITPTQAQVLDGITKVQAANKQYLFTTDKTKAVITNQSFVGKETQDGRAVNHYKAGYDKAHLQAYVSAVKSALDASQLNDWSKKANSGKSLSDVLDFSALTNSIKDAKTDYTFDMYVDTKTKLVHSVHFVDPSNTSSSFTITQNYAGGDSYPFTLSSSDKTANTTDNATLTLTLNTKANTVNLSAKSETVDKTSGSSSYNLDFTVSPSDKAVTVTAPATSTPVMHLLGQLGFGGSSDMSVLGAGSTSTNSDLFTFTQ